MLLIASSDMSHYPLPLAEAVAQLAVAAAVEDYRFPVGGKKNFCPNFAAKKPVYPLRLGKINKPSCRSLQCFVLRKKHRKR